jgi:hypothetical protein
MQNQQPTTIEDLREKSWYRIAKILYILAFLVLSGMIVLVSAGAALYQQYAGAIQEWRAQLPTDEIVSQLKEENPQLENLSREAAMQEVMENPQQYQELLSQVQSGNIDPERMRAIGQTLEQFDRSGTQDVGQLMTTGRQLLQDSSGALSLDTIKANGKSSGFFWRTFGTYAAVGIIGLMLIFEFIRRITYYATLGEFFPPKRKETPVEPDEPSPV